MFSKDIFFLHVNKFWIDLLDKTQFFKIKIIYLRTFRSKHKLNLNLILWPQL